MQSSSFKLAAAGLTAALALTLTPLAAPAAGVQVVLNGQAMTFDQPPVMQAGRVFVPMRAIFEQLGATVVYANGNINAQGRGRSVHLTIGSTTATVNGNTLMMDVAPFEVAGRTEVPLRFVAQALGAGVQWNPGNSTVYINAGGGNGNGNQNYTPSTNQSFNLSSTRPGSGESVSNTHPGLHATFSEPVNRDSLRVAVDGRDITSDVYANPNGFDVTPSFELTPGNHRVRVTGTTQAGAAFRTGWSFTTAAGATTNVINNLSPSPGASVGTSFTLTGHTRAGSHVHVVADAANSVGGIFQIGTGTFQTDVTADGNGYFSIPIALNSFHGGNITVIITSTSPSGASIERRVVYSSQAIETAPGNRRRFNERARLHGHRRPSASSVRAARLHVTLRSRQDCRGAAHRSASHARLGCGTPERHLHDDAAGA